MSFSRTKYDSCRYDSSVHQSVTPLDYILDPVRYDNCSKCRPELGIVGGTAVSHVSGNLVDLENDLRGQNRPLTTCSEYLYKGPEAPIQGREMIKPVAHPVVARDMRHLPPCQMTGFGRVPAAPPAAAYACPAAAEPPRSRR
jgi:hypothetical protein